MQAVNKAGAATLEKLTAGVEVGRSRKLDSAPGTYMAVVVERLSENTFSIAHYFEQNGDLVSDPDMEFWRSASGEWFPMNITHGAIGRYYRGLELEDGKPARLWKRTQADLAVFAGTWMANIRHQQRDALGKAAA